MENADLKCLPSNFVGNSKPSKIIERLIQKKENAEKNAMNQMDLRKKKCCEHYENIIKEKSEELMGNMDEIKSYMKNDIFESKSRANNDNIQNLEKQSFQKLYERLQFNNSKRHDLVEEYYEFLVNLEKEKSKEFKNILKDTYEEIKKISYKLPSESDEFMELEIQKINQSILCNHRNYVELKTHLQLEVENDLRCFIQELRQVRECWIKYLKKQTDKALSKLKLQDLEKTVLLSPELKEEQEQIKKAAEGVDKIISQANVITNIQNATEWLDQIRKTLATMDQSSQKIMMNFKQAAVIIFNRFFKELRVISESLDEMLEKDNINAIQCEIYTPCLEEIEKDYKQGLETIQKLWNKIVSEMEKTVENTYKFLLAGATLWERHFARTATLQVLVLKDIENTIQNNNSSSETYESKLNILIDTLRQEPTKEKLDKTLEDIKKLLGNIEEIYKSQYQAELNTPKKYKTMLDLELDVLVSEIKRFLIVYPPDMEKDPKIQRKRASQTSEMSDPTDGLIPNQMLYCKFQIDALSNWQFGLWETINNYVAICKSEFQQDGDQWVKNQNEQIEKRLEIRLGFHRVRLDKIKTYIYSERLEELCKHQSRFEEHKNAVDKYLSYFKDEKSKYLENYEMIFENYDNEGKTIETKALTAKSFSLANANFAILKAKTQNALQAVDNCHCEQLNNCENFFEKLKVSGVKFSESMKLFSEEGNFNNQEIKDYLKNIGKLESQCEKSLASIKKEAESIKVKFIEEINKRNTEVFNTIRIIKEEHQFKESMVQKIKHLENDLRKESCSHHFNFKQLDERFDILKNEILSVYGSFESFQRFRTHYIDILKDIEGMGMFLYHPTPIRLYSDKTNVTNSESTPKNVKSSPISKFEHKEATELTLKLFNFVLNEEENTLLSILHKILKTYWNDIIDQAMNFYKDHQKFLLDISKIHQNFESFADDILRKFITYQTQIETRWLKDLQKFLIFLANFLSFCDDYWNFYLSEYSTKSLKIFRDFYANDSKQAIKQIKANLREKYAGLQKKLKPLHGHPKNKKLLEILENEATNIENDEKEKIENYIPPLLEKLTAFFNQLTQEFDTVRTAIPEERRKSETLRLIMNDLNMQINEKITLLRAFTTWCELCDSSDIKAESVSHFKTFLKTYDDEVSNLSKEVSKFNTISDPKSIMSKDIKSSSSSTSKTVDEDIFYGYEKEEEFLTDLKDTFERFVKKIERQDFGMFHENLKNEWSFAVETVLDLYRVKYDQ